MSAKFDGIPDAEQLTPGALEDVRRRVRGAPFRNDAVKGGIGWREPRRHEVRRRRIPHRTLDMRRVEQPVLRKFRVELETDEPTH